LIFAVAYFDSSFNKLSATQIQANIQQLTMAVKVPTTLRTNAKRQKATAPNRMSLPPFQSATIAGENSNYAGLDLAPRS
jgi:hypothetical protein